MAERPRLYFGAEDVSAWRARASSTHRAHFERLRRWVDAHLDRQPLRGVDERFLSRSSEIYFEETFAFVSNLLLAYLITEDARYRDVAREWLGVLCTYPPSGRPYSVGPLCATLAHGLDWLGDALPADERAAVRDHLAALVRDAVACSHSPERAWWSGAYLHHDYWIPTAGYGIGALALLGEVPEAEGWLQRAVEELRHALEVQGQDGAWHEGAADWVYTLVLLLLFADGHRRAGDTAGVSAGGFYTHRWLRETWRYRLYCWLPDDTYVYLNDSFRSGRYNIMGSASCHVLRKLASEFRNPYAQWLAERDEAFDLGDEQPGVFRSPYEWTTNVPYRQSMMHCLWGNFLWYDPGVPSAPPDDLPPAHLFEDQGVLIARSGWDRDASVVTFACAPTGGHVAQRAMLSGEQTLLRGASHVHAQANAFTVYARGRYWIVPPGYGRRDSSFQNVVAVNGGGQLWDEAHGGRIVARELGEDCVYVLGDASACYPEEFGIRRNRRHLVFLPPDFLVICDVVEAAGFAPRVIRNLAWQIHLDPAECAVHPAPGRLVLRAADPADAAPGDTLVAHVLVPEIYGLAQSRFTAADGTPLLDRASVVLTFGLPSQVAFVVVLALSEQAQDVPVSRIIGESCVGAVIGHSDRGTDREDPQAVVFRTSSDECELAYAIEPARAARHIVAGLTPGGCYVVKAGIAARPKRWPERALRTADENHVNRISVVPSASRDEGGNAASAAGLLRFER